MSKQWARTGNSYDSDLFGLLLGWAAVNPPAQNSVYRDSRFNQEKQPSFRTQTTNVTNKCGRHMTPSTKTQVLLVTLGSSCLVKSRSSGFHTAVFLMSRITSNGKKAVCLSQNQIGTSQMMGKVLPHVLRTFGVSERRRKTRQKGTRNLSHRLWRKSLPCRVSWGLKAIHTRHSQTSVNTGPLFSFLSHHFLKKFSQGWAHWYPYLYEKCNLESLAS